MFGSQKQKQKLIMKKLSEEIDKLMEMDKLMKKLA